VPPAEIRALRDLTRTRLQLVHDRTREWQRLEKLLEGALVNARSLPVERTLARGPSVPGWALCS
jgi:transposase